jgi:hypothetical protein
VLPQTDHSSPWRFRADVGFAGGPLERAAASMWRAGSRKNRSLEKSGGRRRPPKVIESLKETRENFHGGVERRARRQESQF